MSTRSLVVLIAFVVILGLIAANNQQKWVSLHMPKTASAQVAPEKAKPWITKGDEIWRGTTRNGHVTLTLYAIDAVPETRHCYVDTFLRVTNVVEGYRVRSIKENAIPGSPEPDTDISVRLFTPDSDVTVTDNLLIPSRVFRGRGTVMLGPPEIEMPR